MHKIIIILWFNLRWRWEKNVFDVHQTQNIYLSNELLCYLIHFKISMWEYWSGYALYWISAHGSLSRSNGREIHQTQKLVQYQSDALFSQWRLLLSISASQRINYIWIIMLHVITPYSFSFFIAYTFYNRYRYTNFFFSSIFQRKKIDIQSILSRHMPHIYAWIVECFSFLWL